MAERGKEDGMKEEKDGETRRRGDVDGSVFDQAVMEQRGAEDSEDDEMRPNQMNSLLRLKLPSLFCRKKISPLSITSRLSMSCFCKIQNMINFVEKLS